MLLKGRHGTAAFLTKVVVLAGLLSSSLPTAPPLLLLLLKLLLLFLSGGCCWPTALRSRPPVAVASLSLSWNLSTAVSKQERRLTFLPKEFCYSTCKNCT
jgi:hypothetical protein